MSSAAEQHKRKKSDLGHTHVTPACIYSKHWPKQAIIHQICMYLHGACVCMCMHACMHAGVCVRVCMHQPHHAYITCLTRPNIILLFNRPVQCHLQIINLIPNRLHLQVEKPKGMEFSEVAALSRKKNVLKVHSARPYAEGDCENLRDFTE